MKGILGRPHLPEPVLVRDISSRVGHIQDTLVPQLAHVHLAMEKNGLETALSSGALILVKISPAVQIGQRP